MNLCSFGFHDWEILESHLSCGKFLQRRVCLRCGKKVDEIQDHFDECDAKDKLKADRRAKATELWMQQ
ncbi:MAG: hypothetical protein M0R80_02125 [Proteobacteria bacterium]|jgi:hypothetical protein|nr:hypothetical protein [Pseudomonadota bacterium]